MGFIASADGMDATYPQFLATEASEILKDAMQCLWVCSGVAPG
jgi:hypothetical protein